MARVPIVQVDNTLIATVQEDLRDRDALALQDELAELLDHTEAKGVILDISIVDTVDSFLGRLINDIAAAVRLLGAQTVVVGIQPAVALTLIELGLDLKGIQTALTADKGIALLHRQVATDDRVDQSRGR